MCGIVAFVGRSPAPHVLDAALDLLSHRGPDGRGTWVSEGIWLGSRRLAIFDPSPAGDQPMVDAQTGTAIVFNGAIYNHLELRRELERCGHAFISHADTEVLLRAYLEWGETCVERLNGMWAFVLWDPRREAAFVSRDRLGVKPLVYARTEGGIAIASEPKALLSLDPSLRSVDEQTLAEFLALGRLHVGERTFYDGVRSLPPASTAWIETSGDVPVVKRYWSLAPGDGTADAAAFDALFEDAVKLRLRGDAPVGLTLSGGLDSSAILSAAERAGLPAEITALTSTFGAGDERAWAELAIAPYDNVHLEAVPAQADDDWIGELTTVAWHLDSPGYSPAVSPLWHIMGRARDLGIKVLLEGQGGDELLGGYTHHAALAALRDVRHPRSPHRLTRALTGYAAASSWRRLALSVARELLPSLETMYRRKVGALGALDDNLTRLALSAPDRVQSRSLRERLISDLTRDVLPGLLHYGDAVSMGRSVEARQPFLDVRLIELAVSIPEEMLVGAGETKRVLRDYLRTTGHARIAARRDKVGFPTPLAAWITQNDGRAVRALLQADDSRVGSYTNPRGLDRLIRRALHGSDAATSHLYRLVSTEVWLRACLPDSASA
jgi:asparagine synthase (glutamine-hydrolysing)